MDLDAMDRQAASLWTAHAEAPSDESRNALMVIYLPLADYAANRQTGRRGHGVRDRSFDQEDMRQSAVFSLMDLIGKFDVTRGVPFSRYAMGLLGLRLVDQLRDMSWQPRLAQQRGEEAPRMVSTEQVVAEDDVNALVVGDMLPAPEWCDPVRRAEMRDFRRWLLRRLPRRMAIFAALRFFRGKRLKDVAKHLGRVNPRFHGEYNRPLSESAVSLYQRRVIKRIVQVCQVDPSRAKAIVAAFSASQAGRKPGGRPAAA